MMGFEGQGTGMEARMRKVAVLLLGVFLLAVVVAAEEPMVSWKSQNLILAADTRVGSQLLPAGDYKVKHEMQGPSHVLVLTLQNDPAKSFRLACTMQPLLEKSKVSEQHYRFEGKDKVLVALVFKGDKFTHAF
jgi:hypothetical protein